MTTVLVVDDKEMMRDSVGTTLARAGFEVITADGGEAALSVIAKQRPDAVVTDFKMPGMTGIDLVERVRAIDEDLPVVMMTAFASPETAVRSIKAGAFDYLTKPFEGDELVITIKRAMHHHAAIRENRVLRAEAVPTMTEGRGLDRLLGESPAMRRVKEQVRHVADSAGNVLIVGESGTGKELVARAIHELSARKSSAFLAVNCAALSESLLESELFGHERGAFTGADKLRKGRFELADRGTLLLDEISEISSPIQAKLLRVLQERAFERVGSSVTIGVDLRVIATSNRDLPQSVARGQFRQDLFFRLNVLPIHVPSLRERPEDVPVLVEHFVKLVSARDGKATPRIDAQAMELLQKYPWPGNVRELQNICERAVVLCTGKGPERVITRGLVEPWLCAQAAAHTSAATMRAVQLGHAQPQTVASTVEVKPMAASPMPTNGVHSNGHHMNGNGHYAETHTNGGSLHGAMINGNGTHTTESAVRPLEDMERDAIVTALKRFNGHRQKTAKALGIGVRTLGLKLKKWKEEKLVAESL